MSKEELIEVIKIKDDIITEIRTEIDLYQQIISELREKLSIYEKA